MLHAEVDRPGDSNGIGPSGLAGWQRQRIRTYIEENLDQRIHVGRLSQIVRRSPAHFSRAFKRSFGAPPHAYIVRRRLERAIRLMLDSDASLSEIALSCGFTDQSHLSNLFRQHIGSAPRVGDKAAGRPIQTFPPPPKAFHSLYAPSRRTATLEAGHETPGA